jgi:putative holliday junction resolvase
VTILGLDVGERRIGVAIAETDGFGARPLVTLRRAATPSADAAALATLIDEHGATEIVVGLPLDASGVDGTQAGLTRTWVDGVAAALAALEVAIVWTWQDERLTSHLAEGRLGPMRRGRSGGPPSKTQRDAYRARVDREAAAIILEDALTARRATRPATETSA